MDFRLNPDQETFRSQFTSWLEKNLPDGWDVDSYRIYESIEEWAQVHRDFQSRLHRAGYAGLNYPKEYGGQGRPLMDELIVLETIGSTCFELRMPGIVSHGLAAPTIFVWGSETQKRQFLPKILDGSHIWCQGFSEPNAGSDVVNVSTRAVRGNGEYVVNGQKIWTSYAQVADYCILLVRTDPSVPKHKGLTYLLLDMRLPGVEVRPIKQITGLAEFNEVFLEDVRVPAEMRVGEEGQGWRIALTTLMFERAVGDTIVAGILQRYFNSMRKTAKTTKRSGRPVIEDPVFRQQLAQAYIDLMVVKYHGCRSASHMLSGGLPGPEGSIGKLLWSEAGQRMCETAMQFQGPFGQIMGGSAWAVKDGMWPHLFLRSKADTILAGTSEIQRNIIGERVLGLPKDPARSAGTNGR